jgi:hypothetical protein
VRSSTDESGGTRRDGAGDGRRRQEEGNDVTPSDVAGPDDWAAPVTGTPTGAPGELLVITGMSGAGRSTAVKVLEDVGWYVVDNLPPQLISSLVDLTTSSTTSRRS